MVGSRPFIRIALALACTATVALAPASGWYEPSYVWLVPAALVGLGAAIGRWWLLWLTLVPVALVLPHPDQGDPPAIAGAINQTVVAALMLSIGIALSSARAPYVGEAGDARS